MRWEGGHTKGGHTKVHIGQLIVVLASVSDLQPLALQSLPLVPHALCRNLHDVVVAVGFA